MAVARAAWLLLLSSSVMTNMGHDGAKTGEHHRTIDGVVTAEKSGLLTVKTSEGTSMSVTSKAPNGMVMQYLRSARR